MRRKKRHGGNVYKPLYGIALLAHIKICHSTNVSLYLTLPLSLSLALGLYPAMLQWIACTAHGVLLPLRLCLLSIEMVRQRAKKTEIVHMLGWLALILLCGTNIGFRPHACPLRL